MKIEIIGKQDIKLDPQDTAFCEQGTVLFNCLLYTSDAADE